MKNVFLLPDVAQSYDAYYKTETGKQIDVIEKNVLKTLLQDVVRGEMLELGCGTGHWTQFFAGLGFDVTAIDNSRAMLERASTKKIKATFREANAQNLPFDDEAFGIVASVTMLEFVDNQEQVLAEMMRVLKPGGYLLLGCLNADSVLGKNKQNDDTFREADFFTKDQLYKKLEHIGKVRYKCGVYMNNEFSVLDAQTDKQNTEPVFIGALVHKNF
ncbi:MAG: class I SAM-dependent methyltransferase [Salinivirgaceae bacterium]